MLIPAEDVPEAMVTLLELITILELEPDREKVTSPACVEPFL